jgi:hypothetical protein
MTHPDYRALCAELLAALDRQAASDPEADGGLLRHRARAALAQPEPEGPTDEELRLMAAEWGHRTPVEFARAVLARYGRPTLTPISVSERLPEAGKKVIVHYVNSFGNSRTVCAEWVPAKSRTDDCLVDDDFAEYDEENDEYYWPEGWYESIENWYEYAAVFINDVVTHWQPLPSGPAHALPQPTPTP